MLPCTRSGFERAAVSLSGMYARGRNTSKSWRGWIKLNLGAIGWYAQMTFPGECKHSLTHAKVVAFFRGMDVNLLGSNNVAAMASDRGNVLWVLHGFYGQWILERLWSCPQFAGPIVDLCSLWLPSVSTKNCLFATFGRSKGCSTLATGCLPQKFIIQKKNFKNYVMTKNRM